LDDYRITRRGGKGVRTLNITEKTGHLVAIKEVLDSDDLMIINKSGIIIRLNVQNLRVMGRATQGVRLIRLSENDQISSVEKIEKLEEIEEIENEDQTGLISSDLSGNGQDNPESSDDQDENGGDDEEEMI
jgi:DNA gyrase subunit A